MVFAEHQKGRPRCFCNFSRNAADRQTASENWANGAIAIMIGVLTRNRNNGAEKKLLVPKLLKIDLNRLNYKLLKLNITFQVFHLTNNA